MSAQKGSEMLIKLGDNGAPQSFTAAAGLRTKSLAINSELVDITNSDSVNKWRELLAGAGIKNIVANGSGVFVDDAVAASVLTLKMAGTIRDWQIVVPGLGTFEGAFQINPLNFSGEHNVEVTYEFGLESAGEITFAAA